MNRRLFGIGGAWMLVALVCMPPISAFSGDSGPKRVGVFRLNRPLDTMALGSFVASQTDHFSNQGADISFLFGESDAATISFVENGRNRIGEISARSFLLARASGAKLVAFAAAGNSTIGFYALSQSKVFSPSDFVGKKVAVDMDTDRGTIYQAMISRNSVQRSGISEIAGQSDISSLIDGRVDVLSGYMQTTGASLEQRKIGFTVISPAQFGSNFLGNAYVTSTDTIKSNPKLIAAFLNGLNSAWKQVYDNPTLEIFELVKPRIDIADPNIFRRIVDAQRGFLRPLGARFGEHSMKQWLDYQALLIAQRVLRKPLDLSAALDFDLLKEAYDRPGGQLPSRELPLVNAR